MEKQASSWANKFNKHFYLALAGSALLCIVCMVWVDVPLSRWIDSIQNDSTRNVGAWLEEAGKSHWVLIYAGVVAAIAWRSWRTTSIQHAVLFLAVAASGIAANIIKVIVCRSRPPLLIEHGIYQFDWFALKIDFLWNSFPSGHATTGIAIAIAGSAAYPKLKWFMWTVGLAISFSRVLYNVHYLSDVIGGILLGAVITLLLKVYLLQVRPVRVL